MPSVVLENHDGKRGKRGKKEKRIFDGLRRLFGDDDKTKTFVLAYSLYTERIKKKDLTKMIRFTRSLIPSFYFLKFYFVITEERWRDEEEEQWWG